MSKRPTSDIKNQATKDHTEGQSELFAQLKRKSASELHSVDPTLLGRLTADQRCELFTNKVVARIRKKPVKTPTVKRRRSRPRLIRRIWNLLPNLFKSQIIGASTALFVTTTGMILITTGPELIEDLLALSQTDSTGYLSKWNHLITQENQQ